MNIPIPKSVGKFIELSSNIKKVLSLAYEIDKHLIIKYYVTAFIGAVAPVVAGFIFKFFIDQLVASGQIKSIPSFPLMIFLIFAATCLSYLLKLLLIGV